MTICIAVNSLESRQVQRLQEALSRHEVSFLAPLAELEKRAAVSRAEIVFGNVPPAWLEGAPRLRWVQLDSAGVDAYLQLKPAVSDQPPMVLTNLAGFYDRAVAEAAIAGILALYRQLPHLLAAQREARWVKQAVEPGIRALNGNAVLMLGAGSIARRLERLLGAFDARTRCFSRRSSPPELRTLEELERALFETDLLINTLPHTAATIGFVSRARLAKLKRGAVVVNVGRGSALDEQALVDLIDAGHLAGAVLDVTAIEPLPADSPLWRNPNIVLTQHTGGRFPGETDRKLDVFLDNLARFERHESLQHEVSPARGY